MRTIQHDHLTCRVAWSILSPFTFSSSSASNSSTSTTAPPPTPGQLGAAIRQLSGNGTAPGGFIRIEPDRVLVAITAIEHLVGTCRALHHPLSGGPEGAVSIRCADQQFSPPQGYAAASSFAGSCDAFGVATMPSMEMVEAVELQDEDSYEAEEGGDLAGYGFLATLGQYGDQ